MKKSLRILLVALLILTLAALPAAAFDTYGETFTNFSVGDTFEIMDELSMYFEMSGGTPDSLIDVNTAEDGEQYVRISGYTDLRSYDYLSDYIFSVDIAPESFGNNGVFIRGEFPGAMTKINPKNAGTTQTFNYYEWDWYAENGGVGGSNIGGSGIAVLPLQDSLRIMVKKYAEDSLTVASEYFDLDLPEGVDFSGFTNLKFTDDGKEIKIYCADILMCRIALSQDSVTYETDGTEVAYYKSAVFYDASDAELGTVENTRLHYDGGQVAITSRVSPILVDNIKLVYGDGAAASDGKAPADTTKAPSTEAPSTDVPSTNAPQTSEGTAAPSTETNSSEQTTPSDKTGSLSTKTVIIIIAASVVVLAVILTALFVKPKKKGSS